MGSSWVLLIQLTLPLVRGLPHPAVQVMWRWDVPRAWWTAVSCHQHQPGASPLCHSPSLFLP